MFSAVLDPGVLVAALLSPSGTPARLVLAAVEGRFEMIASPALLRELRTVLLRPKFRRWVSEEEALEFVEAMTRLARVLPDAPAEVGRAPDPGDDYLLALAAASRARCLVSGDRALLALKDSIPPVLSPAVFLRLLEREAP